MLLLEDGEVEDTDDDANVSVLVLVVAMMLKGYHLRRNFD